MFSCVPGASHRREFYFTNWTTQKGIFYAIASLYVLAATVVVCVQPLIPLSCNDIQDERRLESSNPFYVLNPCNTRRFPHLLMLTIEECMFGRRMLCAVALGGVIGWERRQADRPAGIRTMSLVSLGACLFTICSTYGFVRGPMAWDASRISAAIPSGVGFLGAALIFKQAEKDEFGENTHQVHGLTTATSVWLSAAVGIASGGGLFFAASFCTAVMLLLLRFGPRYTEDNSAVDTQTLYSSMTDGKSSMASTDRKRDEDLETSPLHHQRSLNSSRRKRPQLV